MHSLSSVALRDRVNGHELNIVRFHLFHCLTKRCELNGVVVDVVLIDLIGNDDQSLLPTQLDYLSDVLCCQTLTWGGGR